MTELCECSNWMARLYIISPSVQKIYLDTKWGDIPINYCPICGKRISDRYIEFEYKKK